MAESVKVMCTDCHRIDLVDKAVADKIDEQEAYCCRECLVEPLI